MKEKPLILAVDDDENFLEIISMHLRSAGFETAILETDNTEVVITRCEELLPDVVLLDIYLTAEPVGLDIAAALRRNEKTQHIKIILWSSMHDGWRARIEGNANHALEFGPGEFFEKSDDLRLLTEKIQRLLTSDAVAV